MAPKRTSTSAAPGMNHVAIWKLIDDSVAAALEAQAANIENDNNTNRNPEPREVHVARKCSYKEFMSYQPLNFKGLERAVRLIHWFEHTESVFSHSNCTEDCKVKFATGILTEAALSWWNSFAEPIGIEEAYKITWVEFKKLLIKKYYPRTKVQKMKDEFYHLIVNGNDLKTYSEVASPKPKGSLNADEYIGVEEVVGGGEALGIGEDDDLGDAAMDGGDDVVESDDISILNSLIDHESDGVGAPVVMEVARKDSRSTGGDGGRSTVGDGGLWEGT
nr:reverse transcriptase domain-containing protein [Tanacetum cinerariifolium]